MDERTALCQKMNMLKRDTQHTMCSAEEDVELIQAVREHLEESEDETDNEDTECIRMKWIADGAQTLAEVIEKLRQEIQFIQRLRDEGYELVGTMTDDYGFIRKRT